MFTVLLAVSVGQGIPDPPPLATTVADHERRLRRVERLLGVGDPPPLVRRVEVQSVRQESVVVVPVPSPVQVVQPIYQQTATIRAYSGHTHTCPRCGTTWDHQTNPSHNCPRCGTAQYVQDSGFGSASYRPTYAPSSIRFSLPAGGDCANGKCNTGTVQRQGLFSRIR